MKNLWQDDSRTQTEPEVSGGLAYMTESDEMQGDNTSSTVETGEADGLKMGEEPSKGLPYIPS